jgi:hypothetical protein
MLVMPAGRTTEVREEQPKKQRSLMLVSPVGTMIEVRDEHS